MKENNNIEELFKESFQDFEADAGNVWSSIQAKLGSSAAVSQTTVGAKSASGVLSVSKIAIVLLSVMGISAAVYYLQLDTEKQELVEEIINSPKIETKEQKKIAKEPIKEENQKIEGKNSNEVKPATNVNNVVVTNMPSKEVETPELDASEENIIDASNKEESIESNKVEVVIEKVEDKTNELVSVEQKENEPTDSEFTKEEERNNDNTLGSSLAKKKKEEVLIKNIPNIFTPNGDGKNDVFRIESNSDIEHLNVEIYNKSGRIIHRWEGEYGFWDGKNPNGTMAPNGVYFYSLFITKDGEKFPQKGVITLTK